MLGEFYMDSDPASEKTAQRRAVANRFVQKLLGHAGIATTQIYKAGV